MTTPRWMRYVAADLRDNRSARILLIPPGLTAILWAVLWHRLSANGISLLIAGVLTALVVFCCLFALSRPKALFVYALIMVGSYIALPVLMYTERDHLDNPIGLSRILFELSILVIITMQVILAYKTCESCGQFMSGIDLARKGEFIARSETDAQGHVYDVKLEVGEVLTVCTYCGAANAAPFVRKLEDIAKKIPPILWPFLLALVLLLVLVLAAGKDKHKLMPGS